MIERPFRFEDVEAGLLAVPGDPARASRTGVIWLNAGAIRRAGPFRLHTQAARRFASLGFPTLRVDQPGVGDHLPSARRPQREIATALLDQLQRETGCERFVVGGICSAADNAWQWALGDPRVAGLLLLDPLARRTAPGFRLGQLQLLLGRGPTGWLALLARR
ncbi:MAG: alpha/beta hydrolase, partial [Silanimonas sp.]